MSSTSIPRWQTPATFEAYLAQDDARPVGQALCDCCCETRDDCWYRTGDLNPDTICEACARRHHAFELAEEQKVRRLPRHPARSVRLPAPHRAGRHDGRRPRPDAHTRDRRGDRQTAAAVVEVLRRPGCEPKFAAGPHRLM